MGKLYDDYFVKPRLKKIEGRPSIIQTLNRLQPIVRAAYVTETVTKTTRPVSRKPGRPKKVNALTPAERQRLRRARLKAKDA